MVLEAESQALVGLVSGGGLISPSNMDPYWCVLQREWMLCPHAAEKAKGVKRDEIPPSNLVIKAPNPIHDSITP